MPRAPKAYALLLAVAGALPAVPSGEMIVSQNLGASAYSASGSYGPFEPSLAFDGEEVDAWRYWNAGNYAPQWVEVDLGRPRLISRVRLVVAQLPDGKTSHDVWVSRRPIQTDLTRARCVASFSDSTVDREVLDFKLPHPVTGRFVQVRSTRSPSWIAWMEVQVFAAPSS